MWKYDALYKIRGDVAYNNGVVYVGPMGDRANTNRNSGSVIAVNAVTGAEILHKSIQCLGPRWAYGITVGVVYANGMVYLSIADGMIALDASNSAEQWRTTERIVAMPKFPVVLSTLDPSPGVLHCCSHIKSYSSADLFPHREPDDFAHIFHSCWYSHLPHCTDFRCTL